MRIVPVAAVFFARFTRLQGAGLVDRREHDLALQLLYRHAVLLKARSHIFQQFGIGRSFAGNPEVVRSTDNPAPEMPFPNTVDKDSNRERTADNAIGQFQPATSSCKRLRIGRTQDRQKAAWHFISERVRIPSQVHSDVNGLGFVADSMDEWIARLQGLLESFDLLFQAGEVLSPLGTQPSLQSPFPEYKQARFGLLVVRVHRAHEKVHPEAGLLCGQRFKFKTTSRAKLIVGLELIGERISSRALLHIGFRFDNLVLFLDPSLRDFYSQDQFLEGVGEGLGFVFFLAAGRDHGLPVF